METEGHDLESSGNELAKLMRQSDYIGKMANGRLYALLSNTNTEDADYVIRRFEIVGYKSFIQEDVGI